MPTTEAAWWTPTMSVIVVVAVTVIICLMALYTIYCYRKSMPQD
ncbi:hypothetical protein [Corynebacterium pygosceleis]|uniref:Uncharacterized protein n=1 Tax=Corynebacterium pygosceleis TaxID=2800406 RepID=A0A9Q4C8P9_9CORY|nr:hypothetical protein [Corynebacterium pygosceleis]MCX7445657.1 hypothetical protein [Corynebacterium pygosceleis]MCX7468959.1 hypothetical protein [Corynebacterium pygosceleis]